MSDEAMDRGVAVRELEGSFLELMVEFRRYYTLAAEQVSPGMAPGTFRVLVAIDRKGPTTVSHLAAKLNIDKGLISRSVTDLERLGFVDRVVDDCDRRIKRLAITQEAKDRLSQARVPYEHMLSTGVRDWPIDQVVKLSTLLSDLAKGLEGGAQPS